MDRYDLSMQSWSPLVTEVLCQHIDWPLRRTQDLKTRYQCSKATAKSLIPITTRVRLDINVLSNSFLNHAQGVLMRARNGRSSVFTWRILKIFFNLVTFWFSDIQVNVAFLRERIWGSGLVKKTLWQQPTNANAKRVAFKPLLSLQGIKVWRKNRVS